jgi:hypothetical protein
MVQNAWVGTELEQFGDGLEMAIVLSVVGEGMPLIHNGQEAGQLRRLAFFEKDPIERGDSVELPGATSLQLKPWGYRVFVR